MAYIHWTMESKLSPSRQQSNTSISTQNSQASDWIRHHCTDWSSGSFTMFKCGWILGVFRLWLYLDWALQGNAGVASLARADSLAWPPCAAGCAWRLRSLCTIPHAAVHCPVSAKCRHCYILIFIRDHTNSSFVRILSNKNHPCLNFFQTECMKA